MDGRRERRRILFVMINQNNGILMFIFIERLITPEQFAIVLCEDLNLPVALFKPSIVRAINDQIEDYELHVASMVTSNDQVEDDIKTQNSLEVFNKHKQGKNHPATSEKQKEEQKHSKEEKKLIKEEQSNETETEGKPKGSSELRTLIKVSIIITISAKGHLL